MEGVSWEVEVKREGWVRERRRRGIAGEELATA